MAFRPLVTWALILAGAFCAGFFVTRLLTPEPALTPVQQEPAPSFAP
ncbi:MAG TPA: hypothetical protein VLA04_02300 [Verrucomicrobiae bacterium]|nr:hypothetical protein [Verrucomicrobiae bacterium]